MPGKYIKTGLFMFIVCIAFSAFYAGYRIYFMRVGDTDRAVLEKITGFGAGVPINRRMNENGDTVKKPEDSTKRACHTAERPPDKKCACNHKYKNTKFEPEPPADHVKNTG